MSATSVTGRGIGSADKKNRGSEHLTMAGNKIIGPRVVFCGTKTLDGSGDGTIVLPKFTGVSADYMVFGTDANATAAAAVAASLVVSATATTITVKGPASSDVHVVVIKKGLMP